MDFSLPAQSLAASPGRYPRLERKAGAAPGFMKELEDWHVRAPAPSRNKQGRQLQARPGGKSTRRVSSPHQGFTPPSFMARSCCGHRSSTTTLPLVGIFQEAQGIRHHNLRARPGRKGNLFLDRPKSWGNVEESGTIN